jgi:hypothetical protein
MMADHRFLGVEIVSLILGRLPAQLAIMQAVLARLPAAE